MPYLMWCYCATIFNSVNLFNTRQNSFNRELVLKSLRNNKSQASLYPCTLFSCSLKEKMCMENMKE